MTGSLPQNAAARKASPMAEGLLWYFPNALAAVAAVSKAGNDQHNPGEPMHHARGKSMDHADCIMRHLVDAGTVDTDGQRHSAKVAWRALALLQEELEREEGCPLPRNARLETVECGGCAPPVHASPRRLYDESGAIAAAQDDRLCADADTPAKSPHDDFTIAQDPPDLPMGWLASGGVPVESAYLASFGPNADTPAKSPKAHRRVLTDAERRSYGIGDVEPRHPMHAEALRDHDERLFGGEDRL